MGGFLLRFNIPLKIQYTLEVNVYSVYQMAVSFRIVYQMLICFVI